MLHRCCITGLAALLCASCGSRPPPSALSPHLPIYEGRATELFDDGIGAQALGAGIEPTLSPQERDLLRERTNLGDGVVRARVVSLTSAQDDSGPRWFVGLHTVERLTGERQIPDNFTLLIDGKAPGARLVRALDGQIIGARVVAFLREFVSTQGMKGELHFHLAGDSKDETDAVRVAALVGDLRQ
ncbi:MAG: hypothetical protein ACLP1X_23565 [Polyangiaceae bacterium]|jgi:hypothetical protein